MSDIDEPPEDPAKRKRPAGKSPGGEAPFDKWLNRSLHELFDEVMNEPVPPDLLKIVQDDKKK